MKLSIIVPVYNAEKYIARCIKSIINQTFNDFELIIVDDESTDTSVKIIERYASRDRRIKVYKKHNGGSYQTRIFGVEKAKGDYIMFCDADDYYPHKKVFSTLVAKMEAGYDAIQFCYYKKYNHLKRKMCNTDNEILITNPEFHDHVYRVLIGELGSSSLLDGALWNKIYHRKLMNNLISSQDAERIFWADDVIIENTVLYSIKTAFWLA